MPSNFTSLRSARKNILAKLAEEAKKDTNRAGADERFWKLTTDAKTKIGYARLRFLPAPKGEDLPWVRLFEHTFQGPTGTWLFENCPTSLGNRPCPICQSNSKLWNSGLDSDKEIARKRKRHPRFISNVLVIEDPAHPENNGKVFLFKYGPKIHDKIKELIEPEFPDAEPRNPFDLWEGADFKFKSRDVMGYQNYDKSEFADSTELLDGDEAKLEALWEKEYPLAPFVAESEIKSFEELDKRLTAVLTGSGDAPRTAEEAIKRAKEDDDAAVTDVAKAIAKTDNRPTKRPTSKQVKKPAPAPEPVEDVEDVEKSEDADIKAFFGSLNDD